MIVEIQVSDRLDEAEAPDPDSIIAWAQWASGEITDLRTELPDTTELCIQLVTADEMAELNGQYRRQPKPTNVLSFPYDPMPGVEVPVLGDMAICPAVLTQEAAEQGKSLDEHWAHIVIHGVLHLRGFDHIDDADAEQMETIERTLLAQHGIQDPYER